MNRSASISLFVLSAIAASCSSADAPVSDGETPPATAIEEATVGGSDTADQATADEATTSDAPDDGTSDDSTVGTGDAETDPGVAVDLSLTEVDQLTLAGEATIALDQAARVRLVAVGDDHVVETPVTAVASTEHTLPLVGLRAGMAYDVTAEALDSDETDEVVGRASASFTAGDLPSWFTEFTPEFDPERSAPGYTIVEVDDGTPAPEAPSNQYLLAFDEAGEVVWYYYNTGVVGAIEQTPAGTFVSHYWPFGAREVDVLGRTVGNWAFAPERPAGDAVDTAAQDAEIDPDLIDFVQDETRGLADEVAPIPLWADWVRLGGFHHEVWPMPNGNLLTMSTTFHELSTEQQQTFCPGDPNEFGVISDVMVEFERAGRVVRTWDLWDAVDIDETPGQELCVEAGIFAEDSVRDWTHANAAVYDPERDAVIVSSRHTNQIVAFDHLDDEGPQTSVRWILGENGTLPLDGEPPKYQHAVEVQEDGSILLYDNGNRRPGTAPGDPDNPTYSRAVLYAIDDTSDDPSNWTATQTWEHRATEDSGAVVFAPFIGDADRLSNGNVLITHGGVGSLNSDDNNPLRALIIEVEPNGESGGDVVWKLQLGTPDDPHTVYRSERIDSFYVGPLWEI